MRRKMTFKYSKIKKKKPELFKKIFSLELSNTEFQKICQKKKRNHSYKMGKKIAQLGELNNLCILKSGSRRDER